MLGEVAGRQLGEAEGGEGGEGGGRPASGSCPPTALGVKAGGRWETEPCEAGAVRAPAQDQPEPRCHQRLQEGFLGDDKAL